MRLWNEQPNNYRRSELFRTSNNYFDVILWSDVAVVFDVIVNYSTKRSDDTNLETDSFRRCIVITVLYCTILNIDSQKLEFITYIINPFSTNKYQLHLLDQVVCIRSTKGIILILKSLQIEIRHRRLLQYRKGVWFILVDIRHIWQTFQNLHVWMKIIYFFIQL